MQVAGVVEDYNSTPRVVRGQPSTVWSVKVNGEWYGTIWDDLQLIPGDSVSFATKMNGQYTNIDGKVAITARGGGVAPPQEAAPPAPVGAVTTQVAAVPRVDTRDISIRIQSCRKDAIALMPMLLAEGAVSFAAKAKDSEKYDILLALIDELTARNYVFLQNGMDNAGLTMEDVISPPSSS
jgi:hypothetical protein